MNKYKIEFKQIFNRLVTIYTEDEEQAMKVVEQTYLKTDLLDDNEKDLVGIEAKILEKNGEKVPITQKVIMPKIEGAVITAEGAGNINVKTNIIQAVSAATGLSTYRIQVFEMSV